MTRRVWRTAQAVGTAVLLDGKKLRLPSGATLHLATPVLAQAVAAEWDRLGDTFGPADLPLTGLAGAAQERVAPHPAAIADTLATYAGSDLLCYRADPGTDLATTQAALWQPWLDWARHRFGAALRVTTGIVHLPQPESALAALREALHARSVAELAALGAAIPILGSCVLGLALAAGELDGAQAFELSVLDETFQEQRWGRDDPATARRRARLAEVEHAAHFMELSRLPAEEPA